MKKLLSLLLLFAWGAYGAIETMNVPQLGPNALIVTGGWTDFTNKSQRATAGQWVIVPPGPPMHIPTNTLSLLRPGVSYEIYPLLVVGSPNDSVARPIFAEREATTNTLFFHTGLIVSNHGSAALVFSNAATRITVRAPLLWSAATNQVYGVIEQGGGTWYPDIDRVRHDGYDGYWNKGVGSFCFGDIRHIQAVDSALELGGPTTGEINLHVGFAERINVSHYRPDLTYLILGGGRINLRVDAVYLSTNATMLIGGAGGGQNSTFSFGTVRCDERLVTPPVSVTAALRLVNTLIIGPTNATPIDFQNFEEEAIVENVTLLAGTDVTFSAANITDAFESPIQIVGTLNVNKPVQHLLKAKGGLIVSTNAAVTRPTVNLTADNLTLDCTNRYHIALSSDNGTAGNRTFVLSQGVAGQTLTIEWVGTNAGEIADDSANTGGGNARLSATWTPTQYDTLHLRFNGTDWIESPLRSAN